MLKSIFVLCNAIVVQYFVVNAWLSGPLEFRIGNILTKAKNCLNSYPYAVIQHRNLNLNQVEDHFSAECVDVIQKKDIDKGHLQCIVELSRKGDWRLALEYLSSIPRPNSYHFGAALSACEKALQPNVALAIYKSMTVANVIYDTTTHLPLMRCLLRAEMYEPILVLFQNHRAACVRLTSAKGSTEQPELSLGYSIAIKAAQKLGNWKLAIELYDEAQNVTPLPFRRTSESVFNACYAAREWKHAAMYAEAAVLPISEKEAYTHGVVIANKAINACARVGDYNKGMAIFESIPPNFRDGYTYSAVLDLLKRRFEPGDSLLALQLLRRGADPAVPGSLSADVLYVPVTCVLGMLVRDDKFDMALQVFTEAKVKWKMEPDHVAYGTLIVAASKHAPTSVLKLLQESLNSNLYPGEVAVTSTLFNLSKNGRFEQCQKILDLMENSRIKVAPAQYEALLAAYNNGGQSQMVIESLLDLTNDPSSTKKAINLITEPILAALLKAVKVTGPKTVWEQAVTILKYCEFQKEKFNSSFVPWSGLIAILASEGLVEEILGVIDIMERSNLYVGCDLYNSIVVAAYHRQQNDANQSTAVGWLRKLHKMGKPLGLFAYVSAISSCRIDGHMDVALELWAEMLQRNIYPTTDAYNALMTVVCLPSKSCSTKLNLRNDISDPGAEALNLMRTMSEANIAANEISYAITLRALHMSRRHEELLNLWSQIPSAMKSGPVLGGRGVIRLIFRACEQSGEGDKAYALMNAMISRDITEEESAKINPDIAMFGSCIIACERQQRWFQSYTLLNSISLINLSPSRKCWESTVRVLSVAVLNGHISENEIIAGVSCSECLVQICTNQFLNGGDVSCASRSCIQLTVKTAPLVLDALNKLCEWKLVLAAYDASQMRSKVKPDICGHAVLACWHLGFDYCDRVVSLLNGMRDSLSTPNVVSVILAIDLLDRYEKHAQATEVYSIWRHVVSNIHQSALLPPTTHPGIRLDSMTPAVAVAAIRYNLQHKCSKNQTMYFEIDGRTKDRVSKVLVDMEYSMEVKLISDESNDRWLLTVFPDIDDSRR